MRLGDDLDSKSDAKNTMCFQSVDRNLLLDTKFMIMLQYLLNENQRFREIFKENSLYSNCSKLGIMQNLFEIIKKMLSSKKGCVFEWLATNTEE